MISPGLGTTWRFQGSLWMASQSSPGPSWNIKRNQENGEEVGAGCDTSKPFQGRIWEIQDWKWYIKELDSGGEWIIATLQVRDEANEAFLVTICKSLLLILQRQRAAEGLGRGVAAHKRRGRKWRCWLGEKVGGHLAAVWMHTPAMISGWWWPQGGRKMDRKED